jgi:hypothetical protein
MRCLGRIAVVAVAILDGSFVVIGSAAQVSNKSPPFPLTPSDLASASTAPPLTPHLRDLAFSDTPPLLIHSATPPFQQPSILQIRASTRHIVINGWLDNFAIIWDLTLECHVSIYYSVARKDLPRLGYPAFN